MTNDTINDAVTMAGGAGALLARRYRVVRQLGCGGMGSVWLAEDTQLDNKPFAIKMLPVVLVRNKRAYNQLKAEALVAMKLVHPNIVQVRAFEENDGNPFLVMDYIDGQTLDEYLADKCKVESAKCKVGGGISADDVLRILRPIAAALDYAHGEGVVHRDVKPANVMIRKDGHPFILDFGIAREIQETMTRMTGKLFSGTLLYMSPEQLMGDQPNPAQDVYSFAAMAYECLKGEPPFSHGQIEFQIMNKQPDPLPMDVLTGKAAILAAGVMAGLAKQPMDRPPTCTAVLDGRHVERVEGGNGRARSPSGPQPVGRRVPTPPQSGGPRPVAAAKGILAAALIAAFVGGAWWLLGGRNGTAVTNGTTRTAKAQVPSVLSVPEVPSPATNAPLAKPPPPKAGPTDADVKAIAVDAGTQEELVKGIDDVQGYFKERKDDLAKKLARARAFRKEQLWGEAAQGYTNYVNECKKLLKLNQERQVAKESKDKAESARNRAFEAEASHYVGKLWKEASASLEEATNLFSKMLFVDASLKYVAATKQFENCVDEAKAERKRQEKAAAREKAEQEKREREEAEARAKVEREREAVAAKAKAEQEKRERDAAEARAKAERERVLFKAGHKGIQLWEGGPYWADRNIGAEKPEDYGYYFWWGDTVGYKRDGDTWVASNESRSGVSFFRLGFSFGGWTLGNTTTDGKSEDALRNKGWITAEGVLSPQHDAACVHWGDGWRMPTKYELDDLHKKCDWNWTAVNGVKGYEIRGKSAYASARIFLPAAGYGLGGFLGNSDSYGYYWSSVPYSDNYRNFAWYLCFCSGYHDMNDDNGRNCGHSVRPVQGFAK